MKKILFFILTVICIMTLTAGAETPFLRFEFSHNASEVLQKGDKIECTVKYTDINDLGLSSVEFTVAFSDGLEFNNDAVATGLQSGWALWRPNVGESSVRFAVVDETAVTSGRSDMEIKFSFTVTSDGISSEYIQLTENHVYDFDINEVEDFTSDIKHSPFWVGIPEVSVENAGASLRINKTPALRFGVRYNTLPDGASIGVLVCESEKLDGELTHSTPLSRELDVDKKISDGFYSTDALVISSNTEKYTFRPFVMLPTSDGGSYCMYFDTLERSASDVAAAELENETDLEIREKLNGFTTDT